MLVHCRWVVLVENASVESAHGGVGIVELLAELESALINSVAADLSVVLCALFGLADAVVALAALGVGVFGSGTLGAPLRGVGDFEVGHAVEISRPEDGMRHEIFRHIDRNGGIGAHQTCEIFGGCADGQVVGQVIVVGGVGGVLEIVVGDGASHRELGGDIDNAASTCMC